MATENIQRTEPASLTVDEPVSIAQNLEKCEAAPTVSPAAVRPPPFSGSALASKPSQIFEASAVFEVVSALKLHAAENIQSSVRRRQCMLALKDLGITSAVYFFETNTKESLDGSISPRTVEALYKCEVFKNVPPDVLPAVVNNSRRKQYKAGERVVVAGERSESMFIVCSGHLVCEVNGVEVSAQNCT